jgi:hypothetical protein
LGLTYEYIVAVRKIIDLVLDVDGTLVDKTATVRLLEAFNAFVVNDIVAGQNPVKVVNNLFRSSFYSVDGQSSDVLRAPLSALEVFTGSEAQSVTLPQLFSDLSLKISVVESIADMGGNSSFIGVPLGLRFDDDPCSLASDCKMTVTLQILPDHQHTLSDVNYIAENKTMECGKGDIFSQDFTCSNGEIVSLTCDGEAKIIEQRCPIISYETYCSSIGDASSRCTLLDSSQSSVTCACDLPTDSRRRRLQDGSTGSAVGTTDDSSVSFDVVAAGKSTAKEFVSTWTSAGDLTAESVTDSIQVLVTVAGIGIAGIVSFLYAARLDYMDEKVNSSEENGVKKLTEKNVKSKDLRSLSSVSPLPSEEGELKELKDTKKKLTLKAAALKIKSQKPKSKNRRLSSFTTGAMQMARVEQMRIDESLPMVLRPLPLWKKYINEVQMYHRWVGIVCHYSPTYSRPIRILSLLINILIMLFVQSVTYNVADPDDGACEMTTDVSSCMKLKSAVASGESKCFWDYEDNTCHFRPFDDDIKRVIYVALFAAAISAPFAILFQSLIMFVLSAETLRSPSEQSYGQRQFRVVDNAGGGAVTAVPSRRDRLRAQTSSLDAIEPGTGTSVVMSKTRVGQVNLFSDFNNLMSQVQLFRVTLCEEERKEFDRIWGFTAFVNDSNEIKMDEGTRFSRLANSCGQVRQSHREKILLDLGGVQRATSKEADNFATNLEDEKSKSKRLLFLFIKDLMDGVNGSILDVKDRTDNATKRKVTYLTKALTWTFLFVTAMGMLFYIYLFAMAQSESRQRSWFSSFVVWLMFEIILVSSAIVFLQHVVLPLITMGDLRRVKKQVMKDVLKFKMRTLSGQHMPSAEPREDGSDFNAAKFFFPSYKLAELYPDLAESKAILQYSTPYPKHALTSKAKSVQKNYDMRFKFLMMTFSRVLIYLLTSLISSQKYGHGASVVVWIRLHHHVAHSVVQHAPRPRFSPGDGCYCDYSLHDSVWSR